MIRLGQLAAALSAAGGQPLPGGTRLSALTLTVAVSEPPRLAPDVLWRLTVAEPFSRWRGWLSGAARLWRDPPPPWPQVTLTWSNGRVFASLTPSAPSTTERSS